jgi:hypothetical protein
MHFNQFPVLHVLGCILKCVVLLCTYVLQWHVALNDEIHVVDSLTTCSLFDIVLHLLKFLTAGVVMNLYSMSFLSLFFVSIQYS